MYDQNLLAKGESNGTGIPGKSILEFKKANGNCCITLTETFNTSALAQSPKGDIEPNHPSEINPISDSRSRSDSRSQQYCNTG